MKKKILMALALTAAGMSSVYADTKIAVINPGQIFNDTNAGSLSVKKLENELKPEANQLKQEQERIMQEMQDLQKNSATMTKSSLEAKQNTIRKEQQSFTEKAQMLQKKEYEGKEKLSNKFQASLDSAVSSIAQQKGYNMVVTTQSLAYVSGVDDITDQVVAKMNQDNQGKA